MPTKDPTKKTAKKATTKDARCWPGYEPVPGKPEHAEGSCRPKAESKSTPAEKVFRAKRKKQLTAWKKAHPDSPATAAQHLKAPATRKAKAKSTK